MDSSIPTIAVAGASGLVGNAVIPHLEEAGWRVLRLVRRPAMTPGERTWDPSRDQDDRLLDGCQAVLNLAGHPISDWPWSVSVRNRIRSSRLDATRALVRACQASDVRTFLNASAVGYYGDRGEEPLTESSGPGTGFLSQVCREWEEKALKARTPSRRVVQLRLGIVLSAKGGGLPPQWRASRFGLGAILGSGRQWVSWIHQDDLCRAILLALESPDLMGPINVCGPSPVRQDSFARILAQTQGRNVRLRIPGWMVAIGLGGMGRELLLASQCTQPDRLANAGFTWRHPDLAGALGALASGFAQ